MRKDFAAIREVQSVSDETAALSFESPRGAMQTNDLSHCVTRRGVVGPRSQTASAKVAAYDILEGDSLTAGTCRRFLTLQRSRRNLPRIIVMRTRPPSPSRKPESSPSPANQIAAFIAKFDPKVGANIRACRSALRKRLPTSIEQVYDNYNFLAIGFCTSERTSDCICSLACSAKGVALSFYYGAKLPDPDGVLLGSGSQNRYVRLENAATLREPSIAALIDAAVVNAEPPLPKSGRGKTIIKSVSVEQRPRRTRAAGEIKGSTGTATASRVRAKPARATRRK